MKDRSQRRPRRRSKTRGRERWRQTAALALIAVVLAVGLVAAGKLDIGQALQRRPAPKPPALTDDAIYTGSILYMPDQGSMCRQFLFDNRNGRIQDNGRVDCEQAFYRGAGEMAKQWSRARALVISESFRQR